MTHRLRTISPTSIELELDGGDRLELSLETPSSRELELDGTQLRLVGSAAGAGSDLELELDEPAAAVDELDAWLSYCPIDAARVLVRIIT